MVVSYQGGTRVRGRTGSPSVAVTYYLCAVLTRSEEDIGNVCQRQIQGCFVLLKIDAKMATKKKKLRLDRQGQETRKYSGELKDCEGYLGIKPAPCFGLYNFLSCCSSDLLLYTRCRNAKCRSIADARHLNQKTPYAMYQEPPQRAVVVLGDELPFKPLFILYYALVRPVLTRAACSSAGGSL